MTLQEIIDTFRELADDVAAPELWNDARLTVYANEAEREACRRARLIEDSDTAAVCQIAVVNGTSTYAVDPRVLFIRRAKLASQDHVLGKAHADDLDKFYCGWESNPASTPRAWTPVGIQKLRLVDSPDADDTLNLKVIRLPLAPMALTAQAVPAAIASLTNDGLGTATAVLVVPTTLLATGDNTTIAGAVETEYNGAHDITVIDASTFTFSVVGTPASPATGTITYAKNTVDVGPEIADRYHLNLIDWMLYRAFMSRDKEEKYRPEESAARLTAFEAEFGKRSSAIDETWIQRQHGYTEYEGLF